MQGGLEGPTSPKSYQVVKATRVSFYGANQNARRGTKMKVTARLTNTGIEISMGDGAAPKPLKAAPDARQDNPRKSYVYAHIDAAGNIFYVGKGDERRAWSKDRHPLWHRYVERHLGGAYQVRILQDNLSPDEAEELEAAWIAQCSDGLVNWVNMGRVTDFQALERYHKSRDANRCLIQPEFAN
jgi:hypothetical protein